MKTFSNQAAQGDLLITKIRSLPKEAKPVKSGNGNFIVAHSETGHHHVVAERPGVEYFAANDPLVAYLRVADEVEAMARHRPKFDG